MAKFLELTPAELFTNDLLDASRLRVTGLSGASPSQRVGRYGRQPAYWRLRECGIRQSDVGAMLGRNGGQISRVLNGFSPGSAVRGCGERGPQTGSVDAFTKDVLEGST